MPGPSSSAVASHLSRRNAPRLSLVAFELGATLSEHGPVSRGICEVAQGRLRRICEVTSLVRVGDHAEDEYGPPGATMNYPLTTPVSMSFWGLEPEIFPALERGFRTFLTDGRGDANSEWCPPAVVYGLIEKDQARVEVLRRCEAWCGIAYRDDVAAVRGRIAALIDAGDYPARLWT